MCARHRSRLTRETSMWNVRPPIVSWKRCTRATRWEEETPKTIRADEGFYGLRTAAQAKIATKRCPQRAVPQFGRGFAQIRGLRTARPQDFHDASTAFQQARFWRLRDPRQCVTLWHT
jgi:hypothetical protein